MLALIVLGRWDQLKRDIRKAAQQGVPLESIQEMFLQSHLFAGFPRAIEAFENLAEVRAMGIFPPTDASNRSTNDASEAKGRELFNTIYARKAEDVLDRIGSFHPSLRDWILEHAYSRVLARPNLTPKQRELAAVAALIVSRQWRQLMSHIRGAQRCGASAEEIQQIYQCVKSITPPATFNKARKIFQQS